MFSIINDCPVSRTALFFTLLSCENLSGCKANSPDLKPGTSFMIHGNSCNLSSKSAPGYDATPLENGFREIVLIRENIITTTSFKKNCKQQAGIICIEKSG